MELEQQLDSATTGRDCTLLGAELKAFDIKPGTLVTLHLPAGGSHRWTMGRINKLGAYVRSQGGELAVFKEGVWLAWDNG